MGCTLCGSSGTTMPGRPGARSESQVRRTLSLSNQVVYITRCAAGLYLLVIIQKVLVAFLAFFSC